MPDTTHSISQITAGALASVKDTKSGGESIKTVTSGMDALLRLKQYTDRRGTPNSLNQLTAQTTPGVVHAAEVKIKRKANN